MRPTNALTSESRHTSRDGGRGLASISLPTRGVVTNAALLVGTTLVSASALIHVYLWADGYRNVTTIGPLFFAQGMAGLVLAVALVAYPRVGAATVAVAYLAATAIAFAMSATWGLFGFMDKLDAPWAGVSLIVECAGIVCLVAGGTLASRGHPAHRPALAATTTRRERS